MNNLEIKGRIFEVNEEIAVASKNLEITVGQIKSEAGLLRWTGDGFDLLNLKYQFRKMETAVRDGERVFLHLKDLVKEKADLDRRLTEKGV